MKHTIRCYHIQLWCNCRYMQSFWGDLNKIVLYTLSLCFREKDILPDIGFQRVNVVACLSIQITDIWISECEFSHLCIVGYNLWLWTHISLLNLRADVMRSDNGVLYFRAEAICCEKKEEIILILFYTVKILAENLVTRILQ